MHDSMRYCVAAVYCFAPIEDTSLLKGKLLRKCLDLDICGTLLLATEGINGTVAGVESNIDELIVMLQEIFSGIRSQKSTALEKPFRRMLIKLKSEIVTMGIPDVDPNRIVGEYVTPENWNALIQQEDVVLIDTRNDYEVRMGSFNGAIDPETSCFREFPEWVGSNLDPKQHKKIAMFCTGGIRCEKATSYLLEQGFENVYHLDGGILNYLRTIPVESSSWSGDCFVFDERISLGHGLIEGTKDICSRCTFPIQMSASNCENCGAEIIGVESD